MIEKLVYLYLLAPLHTGGATQEGNLLGIARESHTELPYIPSSSIRGRLRAATPKAQRSGLWGNTIDDVTNGEDENLTQGTLWIGDGSILWIPVPSLSHGVIWVSSPMLLRRWARFNKAKLDNFPTDYCTSIESQKPVYLKDAILQPSDLRKWNAWNDFVPHTEYAEGIEQVLVLPDKHCATLIQMALWRQVKVRLNEHKSVQDGSFRYEEAIPPDTLMYFPWGVTAQANGSGDQSKNEFEALLSKHEIFQIGGQESLGRGFVQSWLDKN